MRQFPLFESVMDLQLVSSPFSEDTKYTAPPYRMRRCFTPHPPANSRATDAEFTRDVIVSGFQNQLRALKQLRESFPVVPISVSRIGVQIFNQSIQIPDARLFTLQGRSGVGTGQPARCSSECHLQSPNNHMGQYAHLDGNVKCTLPFFSLFFKELIFSTSCILHCRRESGVSANSPKGLWFRGPLPQGDARAATAAAHAPSPIEDGVRMPPCPSARAGGFGLVPPSWQAGLHARTRRATSSLTAFGTLSPTWLTLTGGRRRRRSLSR